jgi:hypothetical protein
VTRRVQHHEKKRGIASERSVRGGHLCTCKRKKQSAENEKEKRKEKRKKNSTLILSNRTYDLDTEGDALRRCRQ